MKVHRLGQLAALAAALLVAAPAFAANLVQVRVGNHPTFTRVVFEFDARAGYKIERRDAEGTEALIVTLEAASPPRRIISQSKGVESISVEESPGRAIAKILLRDPKRPVKEMILSNPPRVVLDLIDEAAVARARAAKKAAAVAAAEAKKAEAAPETVAKAEKPEPLAEPKKVAPTPKAPAATPAETPQKVAKAEPEAAKPKAAPPAPASEAKKPEPKAAPPVPAEAKKPEPKPAAKPEPEEVARAEAPEASPSEKAAEAPALQKRAEPPPIEPEPPATAPEADGGVELDPAVAERLARHEAEKTREAARSAPAKPKAAPAPATQPRRVAETKPARAASGTSFDLVKIGSIAAGVFVALFALIFFLRRRSLPNDLDVTALAQGEPDPVAQIGSEFRASASQPRRQEPEPPADSIPFDQRQKPKPAAGPQPAAGAGDSNLFDDVMEGDPKMDPQTNDLPARPGDTQAATIQNIAPPSSSGDSDVTRVIKDLEQRMAMLEGKLEEQIEARERLERQVAAQSEELRVQRAAIARTQRALRSLNRSEDDHATEPAPRDPSS